MRAAYGEEIVLLKSRYADGNELWTETAEVDYPDNEASDKYREILRQIQ